VLKLVLTFDLWWLRLPLAKSPLVRLPLAKPHLVRSQQ